MLVRNFKCLLLQAPQRYKHAAQLFRSFNTTCACPSGHSRWSKIKHDKGKVDNLKNKARTSIAQEIATASRLGGPDPTLNSKLPPLIANAKKLGFPKASIETAIARGQGVSASGAPLEPLTIEFMMPEANVAGIIDGLTDSKNRTLADTREKLKSFGATVAPTAFMFDRKGKIIFTKEEGQTWNEEEVLDKAIEAGVEDIEVEDTDAIVYTDVDEMATVSDTLSSLLGLKPESQDLVWRPKQDLMVEVKDAEANERLEKLIDRLEEDSSIQDIYLNTR